jgi:hypothetical protein
MKMKNQIRAFKSSRTKALKLMRSEYRSRLRYQRKCEQLKADLSLARVDFRAAHESAERMRVGWLEYGRISQIKNLAKQYDMPLDAVGRWVMNDTPMTQVRWELNEILDARAAIAGKA